MVEIESRALRADTGQRREIVPRWWTTRCPFQRASPSPRIIDSDLRGVLHGRQDIPDEEQSRDAQDCRTDGRDDVQRGEAVHG